MNAFFHLVNEMSPYLLLGFLLAGLMHVYIPGQLYSKYLSKPSFRSVINAALFGIPLPLCSCGVIPTAMGLRREGASKGAVTSFLVATPQTGVDSIIATYSLMGLPFAIIRPIAALCTALLGGAMVNIFDPMQEAMASAATSNNNEEEHHCCCHEHEHEEEEEHHCCCHEHEHEEEEHHCCHEHHHNKFLAALDYAFVDMMGDIGKWLFYGLVIAALITIYVPDTFFQAFSDSSLMSMLLVLCLAIPMYICATGSIPIAVALIMKGLTPGAGLVLLMAGPASNVASMLLIRKSLGTRTLLIYLTSIISGAVAFGLIIDHLLPRHWFTDALVLNDACCHEETSWFTWGCTILLALLLINALIIRPYILHKKDHCDCCH